MKLSYTGLAILLTSQILSMPTLAAGCDDGVERVLASVKPQNPEYSLALEAAKKFLSQLTAESQGELRRKLESLTSLSGPELIEAQKKALFDFFILANDEGRVPHYLRSLRDLAQPSGKVPPELLGAGGDEVILRIAEGIDAQLQYQGLSHKTRGKVNYEKWEDLSKRVHEDLDQKLRAAGASSLNQTEFWKLLNFESNSRPSIDNKIELQVNGVKAFHTRDKMFESARKSIHIMSWSFEDDATGDRYARLLIKKHRENIDVKVMVDGQTASRKGYRQQLKLMEDAGIEVVRWRSNNPLRAYDGMHRKLTIVDGKKAIGGGMNYGDAYSHNRGDASIQWRDTDLYFEGEEAIAAQNLFAELWNEQLSRPEHQINSLVNTTPVNRGHATLTRGHLQVIDQNPANQEHILRTNLLLIKAAQKSIDIENAYFIGDPAIMEALRDARARGLRVRVLSNSGDSIDVPEISGPIQKSLNELRSLGVEVYLKRGKNTLHSKVMQVDGQAGWVGSWNMHPRSHRLEGETILLSRDPNFNKDLTKMLEKDFKEAQKVESPIAIPSSALGDIFEKYGFDLL